MQNTLRCKIVKVGWPISKSENECPDIGAEHDDDPINDDHAGEEPKEEKPKPNKNVDFLIDWKSWI